MIPRLDRRIYLDDDDLEQAAAVATAEALAVAQAAAEAEVAASAAVEATVRAARRDCGRAELHARYANCGSVDHFATRTGVNRSRD